MVDNDILCKVLSDGRRNEEEAYQKWLRERSLSQLQIWSAICDTLTANVVSSEGAKYASASGTIYT
jgi:hypothetical protein